MDYTNKILLIDDSAAFIRLFTESIIDTDNKAILDHLLFAESGEEGLQLYIQHRPILVLMDVKMPGKGGVETAMDIRNFDCNANIIFLTNFSHDPEVAKAISEKISLGVIGKEASVGMIAAIIAFILKVVSKVVV
jgi:DNA-binding NarL/FixJ family response regulator